jgi:hypothetical protein
MCSERLVGHPDRTGAFHNITPEMSACNLFTVPRDSGEAPKTIVPLIEERFLPGSLLVSRAPQYRELSSSRGESRLLFRRVAMQKAAMVKIGVFRDDGLAVARSVCPHLGIKSGLQA